MVKVGLIGKGKWGKVIDKTINELSLSDDFFNINFVEPEQADWVIISTPNDLHYEQAMYWLGQGKNVFCEKPLSGNLKDAKKMLGYMRNKKNFAFVNHQLRFHPNILKMNTSSYLMQLNLKKQL